MNPADLQPKRAVLLRWDISLRGGYTYHKDALERLTRTTNREVSQPTPLRWKNARQSPVKLGA